MRSRSLRPHLQRIGRAKSNKSVPSQQMDVPTCIPADAKIYVTQMAESMASSNIAMYLMALNITILTHNHEHPYVSFIFIFHCSWPINSGAYRRLLWIHRV